MKWNETAVFQTPVSAQPKMAWHPCLLVLGQCTSTQVRSSQTRGAGGRHQTMMPKAEWFGHNTLPWVNTHTMLEAPHPSTQTKSDIIVMIGVSGHFIALTAKGDSHTGSATCAATQSWMTPKHRRKCCLKKGWGKPNTKFPAATLARVHTANQREYVTVWTRAWTCALFSQLNEFYGAAGTVGQQNFGPDCG